LKRDQSEAGEQLPGCFVVLEGTEGAGKTSQALRLRDRLEKAGRLAVCTREPTEGTPIGSLLNRILHNHTKVAEEALPLLFAADRMDHTRNVIEPQLRRGAIVICDRYVYSSLAYQGAGMARRFDLKWLKAINRYARHPDIVFFLDITPEEGLRRIGKWSQLADFEAPKGQKRMSDDEYFQELDTQKKIREAYHRLFSVVLPPSALSTHPKTAHIDGSVVVGIDASLPFETVHEQIFGYLQEFVKQKAKAAKAPAQLLQFGTSARVEGNA